jgi:glutathione S-transferase
MAGLTLVIGDKHLSSWSMRPWLALRAAKIPFTEKLIQLDRPSTAKSIAQYSPSGRVPLLIDGKLHIWDSLAICEYVAEKFPDLSLWPKDSKQRAQARSVVAEMHSGFANLRGQLSMDLQLKMQVKHLTPGTIGDIKRILAIWGEYSGKSKKFLFGEFGIADAFFAPVVFRFRSYGVAIKDKQALAYMDRVAKHPACQEWFKAAQKEAPNITVFA